MESIRNKNSMIFGIKVLRCCTKSHDFVPNFVPNHTILYGSCQGSCKLIHTWSQNDPHVCTGFQNLCKDCGCCRWKCMRWWMRKVETLVSKNVTNPLDVYTNIIHYPAYYPLSYPISNTCMWRSWIKDVTFDHFWLFEKNPFEVWGVGCGVEWVGTWWWGIGWGGVVGWKGGGRENFREISRKFRRGPYVKTDIVTRELKIFWNGLHEMNSMIILDSPVE